MVKDVPVIAPVVVRDGPCPFACSPAVPRVIQRHRQAAGWSLQGPVWGMDQSKARWPVQGSDWARGLRSTALLRTQLREHLRVCLSFRSTCSRETLEACPAAARTFRPRFPVSSYLEDPFGGPEFGATEAEPNPFLMAEESRGLVEMPPPSSVVTVYTSLPSAPPKSPGHAVLSPWHRVGAQCTSETNVNTNELVR